MCAEEKKENHIEPLPKNLYEAIVELSNDETIKEALGNHVTNKFIAGKLKEWKSYTSKVHQWELEQYLRS